MDHVEKLKYNVVFTFQVPQDSGLGALLMIDKILSHGSK